MGYFEYRQLLASELNIGDKVTNKTRGIGFVTDRTKRTVTIKWPCSTMKCTFKKQCTAAELGVFVVPNGIVYSD